MTIVDANVLLYAVNADADHHDEARAWLDAQLQGGRPVAFTWVVLLAFLRLVTKVGLFPSPMPVADAVVQVEAWLAHPAAVLLEPTSRHAGVLGGLLGDVGAGGNLVNDAHLAAIAIEHGATIVSYDTDFARLPGVRWQRPDAAGG